MRKLDKIKVFTFVGIIFIFSLFTFLFRDESSFIQAENRYANSFPKINKKEILNGDYFPKFEKFYNDAVFQRTGLLKVKNVVDMKIMRKPVISDVIFSKDRTKLFRFRKTEDDVDIVKMNKSLNRWESIKKVLDKKKIPIVVLPIPDQSHMFPEEYPSYAFNHEERYKLMKKEFLNRLDKIGIDYLDMEEVFKLDPDKYYYKGDHHPNFNATLAVYDKLLPYMKSKGIEVNDVRNESKVKEGSKRFIGSHSRKIFGLLHEDIRMKYLEPLNRIEYTRFDNGKKSVKKIFEDSNYYNSYMGGDIPETVINTARKDKPNIMVLGDSTTNALESVLWMNSNKFVSLDFRHYKEKNLLEYLENYNPDIIIVSIVSGYYDDYGTQSIMK